MTRPKSNDHALREWREKRGLSKMDLAWIAGIHPDQIRRYERGFGCSLRNALRIERATNGDVTVEEMQMAGAIGKREREREARQSR